MAVAILGASGSGKTAVAPLLRGLLPNLVVVDWDALMEPAGELAGKSVPTSPETWRAYGRLVHAVVEQVGWGRLVLLTICEPHELPGWPIDAWIVLDCGDDERRARLAPRNRDTALDEAVYDGRRYRELGLPIVDSTGRSPNEAAQELAQVITSRT